MQTCSPRFGRPGTGRAAAGLHFGLRASVLAPQYGNQAPVRPSTPQVGWYTFPTMVRRMPIRLPVRKGAFSFVSRLSFVRETFGLSDPLTKPSEQDAGSEGRTSNIGSKNVFNYPVRSH